MMQRRSLLLAVLLGGTLVAAQSCGEPSGVSSRAPKPEAFLFPILEPAVHFVGLLTCAPLPTASVTQTVGPLGGVINVGPHTLSIPPGALLSDVSITAVAPSDSVNRVVFEPAGLEFEEPASLTMAYGNCKQAIVPFPKRIAYTDDLLVILEYIQSVDDQQTQRVTGRLDHFSSYAAAW
jgi:hypothetical protein